jgi:3-phenylpropionate/trans-cinnamate dioxygenase ferredoxin reductase subunit
VVIAGAGLAGARCAETLRALGFEGRIVLVGNEPVPPYERPALSKEFLLGTREAAHLSLRPAAFWEQQRIELLLGRRVVAVRPRLAVLEGGRPLPWDAFVLATGARARRLPIQTPPGVHVLRTLSDAAVLRDALRARSRLVVIGGGFVGAEVASSARALGLEVTILELGHAPFAQALGNEVADLLSRRYRAHGVDLRTRIAATGFRAGHDGSVRAVRLGDGHEVRCDLALASVGVEPVRELFDHEPGAGAYVCGDASGSGHWTAAAADAGAVAHRILQRDPPAAPPPFFWSDQFGLRLQLVGDPSRAGRVELDGSEASFVARYLAHDGRTVALCAANRPGDVGAFRRELAFAA